MLVYGFCRNGTIPGQVNPPLYWEFIHIFIGLTIFTHLNIGGQDQFAKFSVFVKNFVNYRDNSWVNLEIMKLI
jgi:hypothetical protein